MAEGVLLLGPILFQDFELPERVRWGGQQRLTVHNLPGGIRVIDSLGRDDSDIVWSGVFSGDDAAVRARALDLMRAEGSSWSLTWEWFFYTVVIARFEADYTRSNWIPYRVTCKVVRDETAVAAEATVSLATSVLGDLASAQNLGSAVVLGGAIGALAPTQATQPGSSAYAGASAALARASQQIDTGIAGTEGHLGTASVSDAVGLDTTTNFAGQLAALTAARGYVGRAVANLANADT
jgi:hypothetical protein